MFELLPMNHYNPFKEMDRFFSEPYFGKNSLDVFKTDIKETEGGYLLEADLPGFEKKDINIDLEGDYLTIKAERHSEHEDKDKKNSFVRCERSYGSYSRSFDVTGIDTEKIGAKYENGVLTLTLPKKESTLPAARKLEIE